MDRTEDIVAAADAAGAGLAIQVGRFDDIDLAGGSPAAVRAVLGQHPEGRPQALPCRQLDARLDTAVSKGEAITGRDPRRGVAEIVHGLAPRGDLQNTVFKLRIVGQIPLQLVVAPSRRQAGDAAVADKIRTVAGFEEPGLRIQLGVIELVAPDERQQVAVADRKGRRYLERRVVDVEVGPGGGIRLRNLDRLDRLERLVAIFRGTGRQRHQGGQSRDKAWQSSRTGHHRLSLKYGKPEGLRRICCVKLARGGTSLPGLMAPPKMILEKRGYLHVVIFGYQDYQTLTALSIFFRPRQNHSRASCVGSGSLWLSGGLGR